MPQSDQGKQLSERITAESSRSPFPFHLPSDDSLVSVALQQLINSCCNSIPSRRPPAAQIAQELFDCWTILSIEGFRPTASGLKGLAAMEEEAWLVVSQKRENKQMKLKLGPKSTSALLEGYSNGSAVSAFLIGSLIHYDAVDDILDFSNADDDEESDVKGDPEGT